MAVNGGRGSIPKYAEKLAWLESLEVESAEDQRGRRLATRLWAGLWPVALAIVIVLAIWQVVHLSGWKKDIFPGPGTTLANLWDQLKTGQLWHAIGTTRSEERRVGKDWTEPWAP